MELSILSKEDCFYQGMSTSVILKQYFCQILNVCCICYQGDEVVEWNGRSLQGATFEEVCDIILESKQEAQVELIVHRSKA